MTRIKHQRHFFKNFFFLGIFFITVGVFLAPLPSHAGNLQYNTEVGIPGAKDTVTFTRDTSAIGNYIKAIYSYGIGIVGILAAVVLMIGGLIWLTAGGNVNKVETAKQTIGGALTGLILALTSYMLLYQINPDLVQFKVREIDNVTSTTTPDWEMANDNCHWTQHEQCPNASSYSKKSNPEECGRKPDPAGAAGPEVYKTCCCIPTETSGEGNQEESCVSDGATCNNEQSGTMADCSECCNGWHYEGAQKVCGLGSEGESCESDDNCFSGMYCYDGKCYDGSEGDKCDLSNDQCTEGTCQDCTWPASNKCGSCN